MTHIFASCPSSQIRSALNINRFTMNIIVRNLPANTDWKALTRLGIAYGQVSKADIISSIETDEPRIGIIEMRSVADGQMCMSRLHKSDYLGHKLVAKLDYSGRYEVLDVVANAVKKYRPQVSSFLYVIDR